MSSITTWMRLEPHSRKAEMQAGLENRIHDPLWMLTRQWQFGEFEGQDAGTPVWAAYSGEEMPISLYLPGSIEKHLEKDIEDFSPDKPLEYQVERERTLAQDVLATNRRLAVEAGQQFLRLLGDVLTAKYRAILLEQYKLEPISDETERQKIDRASLDFLDLMANRAVDGLRLLDALKDIKPAYYGASLAFETQDAGAAEQVGKDWLHWCEEMIGPIVEADFSRSTWNPERMEYSSALAAPMDANYQPIILTGHEYSGGHLDWYSYDAVFGQNLKKEIRNKPVSLASGTIPTNLSFRGMAARRLWEFEDAQVRVDAIQAAPTDLARMLLVEFLAAYGNDFFNVPVELNAGSLYRIHELTVTNSFGEQTTISPSANSSWRLFALTADSKFGEKMMATTLFIPPVINQSLESPAIEEVHLLRDEMANMAWAVENIVESKAGQALQRRESYQARRQRRNENNQPVSDGALVYRLDTMQSSLPDFWIPMLPDGQSTQRLKIVGSQENVQGKLMSELRQASSPTLFDEQVPRMGVHIKRTHQYVRWYNGKIYSWIGREKRPGRGEGASGLRYDIVETVKTQ